MKKIIVCSKNKAKIDAVNNVIKDFFLDFSIVSLETESGVSETPIGDDEGIKGSKNRINSALKQDNSGNLYVAMEGIINKNKYGRRYNYSKDKNIRCRIKETSIKTRFCKKNSVRI